jgi:hypothetical protein
MLRRVAVVRNEVSEELSASFIRVTRIGEMGRTIAVTSDWRTLRRNKNLKSYKILETKRNELLSDTREGIIEKQ